MKKLFLVMLLTIATTSAFAQFEKDTKYVGASLSGLNMSLSDRKDFAVGLNLQGGYFIEQDWMVQGDLGIDVSNGDLNKFQLGAKARYYFRQNGLYAAGGLKYVHYRKSDNDLQLTPEFGYCYYLNHYISVEPAVYYDMSFTDFKKKSEFGLKVGIGIYF